MLAVWGDPLALGPSVPTAPILPTPTPPLPTFGLLSPPVQGGAQVATPGEVCVGGGGHKDTVTPLWTLAPAPHSASSPISAAW